MPVMVDSEGKYVSFTPTAPVAAGAIVALRELVGIAPVAIAAGSVGQIAVRGIVRVPVTHTKWTCTPIMDTHDDPIRPSRSPRTLRG